MDFAPAGEVAEGAQGLEGANQREKGIEMVEPVPGRGPGAEFFAEPAIIEIDQILS